MKLVADAPDRPDVARHARGGLNLGPKPRWLEPMLNRWPPFRLLAGLRPWGPAVADSVDRVACWRFDLQPPGRLPIERITLWFARDNGRLVQSRLLLRGPRMPTPARLQTRFARIEGHDLPVHRRFGCILCASACVATRC